jgi:hypothetical protein
LKFGSKQAPEWAYLLEAAKDWGMPPWEIEGKAPTYWLQRWQTYRQARYFAEHPEKMNDFED